MAGFIELGCVEPKKLNDENLDYMEEFGAVRGDYYSFGAVGATKIIAERFRHGLDLSYLSMQFSVVLGGGAHTCVVAHHGNCAGYRFDILGKASQIKYIPFSVLENNYLCIEKTIQLADMLSTFEWLKKDGLSEIKDNIILAYGNWQGCKNPDRFDFEEMSKPIIAQEIKSLGQELSADFTQEQLACLGVV